MKSFTSLTGIFKAAAKPKRKEEDQPEKETSSGQMSMFDDLKKADDEEDEDEKRDKKLQDRLDEEAAGGEEAYKLQKEEEEDDDAEKALSEPDMVKGGPFIGPRGGKWADSQHKIPWSDKKHSGKSEPKAKEHDEHGARELELEVANNQNLYRKHEAMKDSLTKKIANGAYDHAQATKLFMYLADAAAKENVKEFGGSFSPATRRAAARTLANEFHEEVKDGEHDDRLSGVYAKRAKAGGGLAKMIKQGKSQEKPSSDDGKAARLKERRREMAERKAKVHAEKDGKTSKSFSDIEGMDIVKNMAKVQAHMKNGKSIEEAVRAAYPDYTDKEIAKYLEDMKKGYGVYRAKKKAKKMMKADDENARMVMKLTRGALEESMSIMRGDPTKSQVATALSTAIKKGFNVPVDDVEGMIFDDLATCDNVARKSFANACMMTDVSYPELQVAGDMVGHLEELAQG